MDTERLWWEARVGFGRAPPQDVAGELGSVRRSGEALEGVGESGNEEPGVDEEEEDEEEENTSDTLLQELWKDCREGETKTRKNIDECHWK